MADEKTTQPSWAEETKEAQKIVDDSKGFYKTVVYVSNDDYNCRPVPFWDELKAPKWPWVPIDMAPEGLNNPVFDWTAEHPHWVEVSQESQAKQLSAVQKQVNMLTTTADSLAKAQTQVVKQSQILQQQTIAGQKASMAMQKTQVQMLQMLQHIATQVGAKLTDDKGAADDSKADDNKEE